MLRLTLTFIAAITATNLFAGYAARDLIIPVAGHATSGSGRTFESTLWLTNVSSRDRADVTITFHNAGKSSPAPHISKLQLAPSETRITSVDANLLGAESAIGALRIESTTDLLVDAQIASRQATDPESRGVATSFAAIPRRFAIGSNQSTLLHGVALHDPYRYKVYVAEVTGQPLHLALALIDGGGNELARKLVYVSSHEQLSADLAEEFPNVGGEASALRVIGVNGTGRVVVAGTRTASESQDATAFEMSLATAPRNRMPTAEIVVYVAIALALIVAAVARRK